MRKWRFVEFDASRDTLQDPISSEFFSSEAIKDSADALVRESIQNSLDARTGRGPVTVRIILESEPAERPFRDVQDDLFGSLSPHVLAERNGLEQRFEPRIPAPFVAIEDFGTSGLEGDPTPHTPQPGERNDFFAFFRAEGWTNKGEESMGRWGIGKTVFPRSSQMNGLVGWTIRASDNRSLLMGRCILKGHYVQSHFYLPHGQFGDVNDNGVMPVESPGFIRRVKDAFRLTRDHEPGLSVVVPHIDPEEITGPALIGAVVRNYFYPVLTGELVVVVSINGIDTIIDDDTLSQHAMALDSEQHRVMALAKWQLAEPDGVISQIPPPTGAGGPNWEAVEIPLAQLISWRERYLAGSPLAFRVHVTVRPKVGDPVPSHMDVILQRVGEGVSGRPVYIREGIVITDARGRKVPGVVAIVHAAQGALANLLGDSENVAHTIWARDTKGFKEAYTYANMYLEYVKSAPAALVRLLSEGDKDEDAHLLERFFGIDIEEEPETLPDEDVPKKAEGETKTPKPKPDVPRRLTRYSLTKVAGGFTLVNTADGELPEGLRVRVAYNVRRGNPLKKYHQADFQIGVGSVRISESAGLTVVNVRKNEILVRVAEKPFKLAVEGFDERRDLVVRVDDVEEDGDS